MRLGISDELIVEEFRPVIFCDTSFGSIASLCCLLSFLANSICSTDFLGARLEQQLAAQLLHQLQFTLMLGQCAHVRGLASDFRGSLLGCRYYSFDCGL